MSAGMEVVTMVDPAVPFTILAPHVSHADGEAGNLLRGILVGTALSLPLWGAIVWVGRAILG